MKKLLYAIGVIIVGLLLLVIVLPIELIEEYHARR